MGGGGGGGIFSQTRKKGQEGVKEDMPETLDAKDIMIRYWQSMGNMGDIMGNMGIYGNYGYSMQPV